MAVSDNSKRLKALRSRAVGLRELARAIGWDASKYQYYEDSYKKLFLPRDFIERIRPHLVGKGNPPITNAEIDALAGLASESPEQTSFLPPVQPRLPAIEPMQPPTVVTPDRADIPVWASVAAGDGDGEMILTSEPIDFIRRSERTANVRDPFAFHVVGDSMLERLAQGDQVVINPAMPLLPMTDCVFIHQGEDGMMYGLVKRLVRATGDTWKVRQLNPPRDYELSRRKWTKAYRVAEIRPKL